MQVELTNLAFDDFLDATSLARKTPRFNSENELDEILEELMFINIEE